MTVREEVICPVCNNTDRLVGLRTSGYYDSYNKGRYVHYGCLSERRKAEIAAEDAAHKQRNLKRASHV